MKRGNSISVPVVVGDSVLDMIETRSQQGR